MMDRYSIWQIIGIYVAMAAFLIFLLLPFFEMFMASLRPLEHLFRSPYQFWSDDFSFKVLPRYVEHRPVARSIYLEFDIHFHCRNIDHFDLCYPGILCLCAFRFSVQKHQPLDFLGVNMFTGAVLLIPLYRVMATIGILNTYWAMIVPGVAFLIPTGIWLLRSYLEKIPVELEEAAFMDGASRIYTLRRVVLPLALPGLLVVSIAVFIGAYAQQFLFAITFNQTREYQPLPAGLFEFIGYQSVTWNEMMAAALTGVLPVMIIFLFLQKYLVAGLTAGAVKE